MKVIIYKNSIGGVSVVVPTGELPIEEVLIKDSPEGSIIVDAETLPQGNDSNYFDAWELVDGQVIVNETKKQAIIDAQQAAQTAKQTAIAKLTKLGLTADEITALTGITQ